MIFSIHLFVVRNGAPPVVLPVILGIAMLLQPVLLGVVVGLLGLASTCPKDTKDVANQKMTAKTRMT